MKSFVIILFFLVSIILINTSGQIVFAQSDADHLHEGIKIDEEHVDAEGHPIIDCYANVLNDSDEPVEYEIAVALTNIGFIDRQSGSYELTFWLTVVTDETVDLTKHPPEPFDFTNGNIEKISGKNTEPHFYKEKVQGIFFNDIDFSDYPFEHIDLAINIETFFPCTIDDIIFTINEDYVGQMQETVSVPGWDVGKSKTKITTFSAPWADFPHAEFIFPVETSPLAAFMKKIFPVGILAGFAIGTFFMSPQRGGERLSVLSAVLVGSIFYHAVFLLGELPPIGYLTLADKIMMSTYSLYVFSFLAVLIHRHYYDTLGEGYTKELADKKDHIFKLLTVVIIFGVFGILYML